METVTCSIPSVIRSPTITAFRNSNLAGGIAGEIPHDQSPPVIQSRLTGTLSDLCAPTREPPTIFRMVQFGLPRNGSTALIADFGNFSNRRLTAPRRCLGQRSEQCTLKAQAQAL